MEQSGLIEKVTFEQIFEGDEPRRCIGVLQAKETAGKGPRFESSQYD